MQQLIELKERLENETQFLAKMALLEEIEDLEYKLGLTEQIIVPFEESCGGGSCSA